MLNKVILCGRLTKTPELYKGYIKFNLSIIEEFTARDGIAKSSTTLHPVTVGGRIAESFVQHAKEGDIIVIEGKLSLNMYQDGQGHDAKDYRTFGLGYKIIGHVPSAKDLTDFEAERLNRKAYESLV